MTLEELAARIESIPTGFENIGVMIADLRGDLKEHRARMDGALAHINATVADGGRAVAEVRDELRLVRTANEDTRIRTTALEGRVKAVEDTLDDGRQDRRASWSPFANILVGGLSAVGAVLATLWAAVWGGHHGVTP